jgi:hypothetical protein
MLPVFGDTSKKQEKDRGYVFGDTSKKQEKDRGYNNGN